MNWILSISLFFIFLECTFYVSSSGFDVGGRISQVEYAYQATLKAGTILASRTKESFFVFTISPKSFNYVQSSNRILPLSKKTFICGTGISADVRYLTNEIFEEGLSHSSIFHADLPMERAAETLASKMHKSTIEGPRPFGASFVMFGESSSTKNPFKIIEIDPMGNMHECSLSCIGKYSLSYEYLISNSLAGCFSRDILASLEKMKESLNQVEESELIQLLLKEIHKTISTNDQKLDGFDIRLYKYQKGQSLEEVSLKEKDHNK